MADSKRHDKENYRGHTFRGAKFSGAIFIHNTMQAAYFYSADLSDGRIEGSTLVGVTISECNLSGLNIDEVSNITGMTIGDVPVDKAIELWKRAAELQKQGA